MMDEPISRAKALAIAHAILWQAEEERLEIAEAEAACGVQCEDSCGLAHERSQNDRRDPRSRSNDTHFGRHSPPEGRGGMTGSDNRSNQNGQK